MSGGGNIKVVVRCRPLNSRELSRGAKELIEMRGNQTILHRPDSSDPGNSKATKKEDMAFTFDKSYWSADKKSPTYADQKTLYNDLGVELLDHSFEGYNTCIFAYGQTGSGKSYSMMGYGEDKGIIPLTCSALFERISDNTNKSITYKVQVSYIEIYNERVRDLLNPKNKGNLKVREHPVLGPYVEDLSKLLVNSFDDIENLMDEGNKARTVAATNMNATSSRSHAVFTLLLTQKRLDEETKMETEKVSRISLVDLAGSERANSTGATGDRLKEGANINKSLTTLGKVIAALADQSAGKGSKKKDHFVPYRDSVLTWLLKDSLGGNSKTAMIAAISPADYDETLSTLRYADQAKRIKNKAVVNEDPNAKLIRELKEELSQLRSKLGISPGDMSYSRGTGGDSEEIVILQDKDGNTIKKKKGELMDQLQASEKLMSEVNESWEEKLRRTQEIQLEREKALEELGIMVEKNAVGVHPPKKVPHLVNLNEDPLMSECLVYQIKSGITRVGRHDDQVHTDIRLSGENILPEHCYFENKDGVVTLYPTNDSLTIVNGIRTSKSKRLKSGYRVILGDFHVFRYNNPEEVRRERAKSKNLSISITTKEHNNSGEDTPRADSPTSTASLMSEAVIDWNYAKKEAALNGPEDIQKFTEDIKKEMQQQLELQMQQQLELQKQEYEEKMCVLTASNIEADELKAEKKQMEEKLKMVQEEMQRMLEIQAQEYKEKMAKLTAAQATFDHRHFAESRPYTDQELRLIHKTLKKWKHQRYVQMAETILSNAVVLKEANVISRELGKKIQYQLTIIEDEPYTNPVSFYETTSALNQYNTNEDTSLHLSKKPCVGVKVIDFKNEVVYVWSLDKLKARMQKMRNLYNYIDRPQFSKHFNSEDPFYENPCPQFTFIGSASMALRCLILKSEYEQRVPVICRYSGKAIAECLVRIKFISDSKQSKDPSENTVFEVRIEELTGMDEKQYTQIHVQFKLSSFGAVPPLSSGEHIYATDFYSDFDTGPIRFDYAQTLSVALTPAIVGVLTNGMLAFEIYGKAKPCVLQQIEKWDEIQASTGDSLPELVIPRERRSEEELVAEEKHDVVAWVQVCEMAPSGDYVPVQVLSQNSLDPGAFFLRQGLQRRIVLTLTHNSGRQFPWSRVTKMEIGHVRLLDGKGRLAESPTQNDVQMNIVPPQKVEFNIDGTSTLVAQCSWDSTLHGSLFLNRTTQSNSRVLLRLTWYVEAEKCVEPICFNMDIAVQIQGREARPPSRLIQLLNSSKVLWKTSGLFSITLKPPMTRKISELWRLNTANKYVRGEELLANWKPRGVSLVKDYKRISESIRKREAVEFMRQVHNLDETRITIAGASSKKSNLTDSEENKIITKHVNLWKKRWGTTKEIVINQDPPLSGSYPDAETYKHTKDTKLVAQVRMVGKTDQITKRGYLHTPENADDYWVKRWYVLRRPYLFIYESQKETEELGAINLSSVRVDYMKEREDMLKRQYVFSIYTNNNAYMLQASSKQEMIDWISKIDQFYQNANLD